VIQLCRLVNVSRSGYYAWRNAQPSQREIADGQFEAQIMTLFEESYETYGYASIWKAFQMQGVRCGKHRVRRLMRKLELVPKQTRGFKRTTTANPAHRAAPNLLHQDFTATELNQKWAGDVTYIRTGQGWLYLAVMLDLCSRRVVGWAMGSRNDEQLTARAMRMALEQRRPANGLLHHSDRGSTYTARDYRALLASYGCLVSMSGLGNCYDNAVVESFFATLKQELVYHATYKTRKEAETDIFFYIEGFYNRRRRHTTLDYLSPAAFETAYLKQTTSVH
jgi:putative transposase